MLRWEEIENPKEEEQTSGKYECFNRKSKSEASAGTKKSSDLDQELAQWHIYYIKLEDQEVWLIGCYLVKQLQSIAVLAFIWLSQAPWRP